MVKQKFVELFGKDYNYYVNTANIVFMRQSFEPGKRHKVVLNIAGKDGSPAIIEFEDDYDDIMAKIAKEEVSATERK